MLIATGKSSVTYPVVVVEVCGIRCRALLDTGASQCRKSSEISKCSFKQQTKKSKSMMWWLKPLGKFSPAHRDNKGEPWCAANPNQSLVQRHLGGVQPPERSGNGWRWFEERAPRPLNPRNKRIHKNQDEDYTQNGETWTTDSWTYALWMDLYVFWKRTRLNQGISDPDIQIWLWRAL